LPITPQNFSISSYTLYQTYDVKQSFHDKQLKKKEKSATIDKFRQDKEGT